MSDLDWGGLCNDVQAEHDGLAALLTGLGEEAWSTPTPAPRWDVRDQICHLAYFDDVTRTAVADPAAFAALRDEVMADIDSYVDKALQASEGRSGPDMLAWWATERRRMLDAMRPLDPSTRVPWFGPAMSLASKATARLMETWAHGQDVVDALGLDRPPTNRLRHVAMIGVRAFPNSFRANGLELPTTPVRVALTGPDGDGWSWGEPAAPESVVGSALDFCLVVTQRRHVDDTDIVATGDTAKQWMSIAQAFAGPPGAGRKAGQFPRGATS